MKTINTQRLVVFDNANTTIKVDGKETKFNEWKYIKLIGYFIGRHEFKRVWLDDDDSQTYLVDFNKLKENKLV